MNKKMYKNLRRIFKNKEKVTVDFKWDSFQETYDDIINNYLFALLDLSIFRFLTFSASSY
jgi:hypothetical protein